MDSEQFYQQGRLLIHSIGPQPLTVNSPVFSLNISVVAYGFFLKMQHGKMLLFWDEFWDTEHCFANERFITRFITCSDGTGPMGSGTAQVAFPTL